MPNSPEDAFCTEWATRPSVLATVPISSFFIGMVPLVDEADTTELQPPFATIRESTIQTVERTNENQLIQAIWILELSAVRYKEAKELALACIDEFSRIGFTWDRGTVADMKLESQAEPQDADGLWKIAQTWLVTYSLDPA